MAAVSGTGSARSADYARPSAGSSANPTDAAVPPTSSLPAAATAPELITNLHRAARAAGVTDSDPMLPLILALAQAIGFLDSRLAWNESLLGESSHRMLAAMQSATTTSAAEEKRLLAALHKAENEAANRLTRTVWGALERLLERKFARDIRSCCLIGLTVLLVGVGSFLGLDHWRGGYTSVSQVNEDEISLKLTFSGPEKAREWMEIVKWDSRFVMWASDACREGPTTSSSSKPETCSVQLLGKIPNSTSNSKPPW